MGSRMPTENLEHRFTMIPPERRIWLSENRGRFAAKDVLEFLETHKELRRLIRGRNVALLLDDDMDLAFALAVADGEAQQILILSSSFSDSLVKECLATTDTEVVLTASSRVSSELQPVAVSFGSPERALPVVTSDAVDSMLQGLSAANGPAPGTRWIIPTSGTTGTPKLISHTLRSLTRTCRSEVAKEGQYSWGLLYSVTRFAGLQVFLQSLWSGSPLVFTDARAAIHERIETLVAHNCNCLSATPSLWRRILMCPQAGQLQLAQVTLGGEIADEAILQTLSKTYPNARVVHIYASTEAGVGFAIKDEQPGFPKAFLSNPPNGVEIRVVSGRLLVKPHSREQALLSSQARLYDSDGFIDTGDLVKLVGDRFIFLGRENGAINIGGHKVHPEEVVSVLLRHKLVGMARVKARTSSMLGSLVEADVVLVADAQGSESVKRDIQAYCREHLGPVSTPAFVNFVDDMVLTDTGKISQDVNTHSREVTRA